MVSSPFLFVSIVVGSTTPVPIRRVPNEQC